jgi:peroxiredoxin
MKGMQGKGEPGKGEHAPDFTLATAWGNNFSLSELLKERCAVLLVFLRHLG